MAIKFSSQGLFRAEISKLIEDSTNSIPNEVKKRLGEILEQLNELTVKDSIQEGMTRVVGQHFDVGVTTEFIEMNMNPDQTVLLYLEVYRLIKDKFVSKDLYRWMDKALREVQISTEQLGPEGKELLYLFSQTRIGASWPESSLVMCAKGILAKRDEGRGNKERY